MAEPVEGIDLAPLEALIAIRREQTQLQEYRTRAEQLRERFDPAVFQRVLDDYAQRHAALDARAVPLKERGREEYAKLRVQHRDVFTAHEEARLAKEELEFRHAVGELDEAQLAERLQEPDRTLAQCREELTALDACKARFVEAFGSEQALESEPEPTPEPEPVVVQAVPPAAVLVLAAAGANEPDSEPDSSDRTAIPADGATGDAPTGDRTNIIAGANVEGAADDAAAEPIDARGYTIVVPPAVLIGPQNSDDAVPHRLGLSNSLGRSEENHICVPLPSVSRQHAVIAVSGAGFAIEDLRSQNGTFVNGERITKKVLQDGDRVTLGDAEFIFNTSASAGATIASEAMPAHAAASGSTEAPRGRRDDRS